MPCSDGQLNITGQHSYLLVADSTFHPQITIIQEVDFMQCDPKFLYSFGEEM